jgi:hypothetical protein
MLCRLGILLIIVNLLGIMVWRTAFPLACAHSTEGKSSNQVQEKKTGNELASENHDDIFEGIWSREVYEVHTASLAKGPIAIWTIFTKRGTYEADFETAKDLVEHYHKQPKERRGQGIFIYSHTYAVPGTPEERRWMTQYLWELYNNPEWRKSEAALIENLRLECEKQKLPLYVNLSGNLQGKWKKLAPLDR